MTPEERFTKIENALNTVAERQALHEQEMTELRALSKVMMLSIERTAEIHQKAALEFQAEIKASRKEWEERHRGLEEKLHALIGTVDRIIRERNEQ